MLSNILYVFTHGGGSNSDKGDDAKDCLLLVVMMLAPPHSLPSNSFSSCSSRLRQHTLLPNSAAPSALSTHYHCSALQNGVLRCRAGGALLVLQLSRQRTRSCLPSTFTNPPLHQHRPCSGLVLSVKVPTPNVCTDGKERC